MSLAIETQFSSQMNPVSKSISLEDSLNKGKMIIEREFVREKKDLVVQETIVPEETIVVQPILEREVERTEIHEIVQPFSQTYTLPPTYEETFIECDNPNSFKLEGAQIESCEADLEIIKTSKPLITIERITHKYYKETKEGLKEIRSVTYRNQEVQTDDPNDHLTFEEDEEYDDEKPFCQIL
eukprot:TRINITY_DN2456_c0_g1_i3.p1 TRINITY_DN2456_c0_g1~~TRINITY_DN2456_c0_g1_i3.p1  ORF type:complete len:183 (-),score=49.65 TRINITY_DN2456_c0_g1_i3:103-651(-)